MTAKKIIPKLLSYFERPYTAWLPRSNKKAIKKLDYIDIDVVSHCNLKCKGCSHFSPIAAPAYLDVNKYEQDINQLRKIVPENKLGNIFLIGGESRFCIRKSLSLLLFRARHIRKYRLS